MRTIQQVAVLGAGVMGATIAAHLANAGLDVLLLDMVPRDVKEKDPKDRNRLALGALKGLEKMKPAALFLKETIGRIQAGNFDDDMVKLKQCDWVIEVVIENMDIKKSLFTEKVAPNMTEGAILSTNTSGLSVNELAECLPEPLRKNFLVTHFFNPPRYMRLMEIVPCQYTDPKVTQYISDFISKRLGKGIVNAKDTANFIANRIGVFSMFNSMHHMVEMDFTVEQVDAVGGPAIGRPKSAAFRTADLVGLDTLAHVANNSYDSLPDDEKRETFKVPEFLNQMIEQGLLGNKSKSGFYKKTKVDGKKAIFYYDYKTAAYVPLEKPKFPSLKAVKMVDDPAQRVKMVVQGKDQAAEFGWRNLRDTLIYSFNRIPEIADDIINIDNGMKWGFNWELGPFETLDAIGVAYFVKRAEEDGIEVPEKLKKIKSFYKFEAGKELYYDVLTEQYQEITGNPEHVKLSSLKKSGALVEKTANCSIVDLGDGVFGVEFHSKMNAVTGDILQMVQKAIKRAEKEGIGVVLANQGTNFSVGANLMMLAVSIAEGELDDINMMVRGFQKAMMAIKYSKVPVVAAPFNLSLGGGCEMALHADAINAYAETYMGLVEMGVGLLPAGGGTKEMCLRAVKLAEQTGTDVTPFIFKNFQNIGMAKVSMSADQLYDLGYMREGDSVTMNIDNLISDAKKKVIALA
ncbi:MAG: 3-hydroxyacyl-CoA dehydrogenase, partial [SAR324 cluster bacterium]